MDLQFEWDEEKEQINIAKHGIDFVTASGPSHSYLKLLCQIDLIGKAEEGTVAGYGD